MKLRLALVLPLLALAFAPAAEAKSCVRIAAPRTAESGRAVTVRVTTLLPTWENGRLKRVRPMPSPLGSLRVDLRDPSGRHETISLHRAQDQAVWVAILVFPRAGTWTLSVPGWESAPRECAPDARVLVR